MPSAYWFYSENARVCAKWQWNARDTSRVRHQSSAFHCHFAHPRAFSLSSHTYSVPTEFWWIFNTKKLLVVTYFSNSQFVPSQFVPSQFVPSSLGETCHLKGGDMVTVWQTVLFQSCYRLRQHASALWRHAVWIRIVPSHNTWMGYEYSLPNMNRPRAIHKHDPHPLETMGRVW